MHGSIQNIFFTCFFFYIRYYWLRYVQFNIQTLGHVHFFRQQNSFVVFTVVCFLFLFLYRVYVTAFLPFIHSPSFNTYYILYRYLYVYSIRKKICGKPVTSSIHIHLFIHIKINSYCLPIFLFFFHFLFRKQNFLFDFGVTTIFPFLYFHIIFFFKSGGSHVS